MQKLFRLASAFVGLSLVALCGCGGLTANSNAATNSNSTGGSSQLTANPSSLAFGSVSLGSSSTVPVTVTNSGTASASVSNASYSGPGFAVSGISTPAVLSAGQSMTFTASFSPSSAGSASGSVQLSDSSGNVFLRIPMSGTGTSGHTVSLNWGASSSSVAGYRIYRGTTTGGPYSLLSTSLIPDTTFIDSSITPGNSYFYVVTAVDPNNNESAFSNQASATVPTP